MRCAARKTFFRKDFWTKAHTWATMGIEAMEHRIVLEEEFSRLLYIKTMQFQHRMGYIGPTPTPEEERESSSYWGLCEFRMRREYKEVMNRLYHSYRDKVRCDRQMLLEYQGTEPLNLSTYVCW